MPHIAGMSAVFLWFRQDLRLTDNPALLAAHASGLPILPVYILDDVQAGEWRMGGASRWWLHHSLNSLNKSVSDNLLVLQGDAEKIIPELVKKYRAQTVLWNRCYEPWRINRDKRIKEQLQTQNIKVDSFNASLLWEPWKILKSDGTPYKVFTPFYRKGCLSAPEPDEPVPAPSKINWFKRPDAFALNSLKLLPQAPFPRWDSKMEEYWDISEAGAQRRLAEFLETGLKNYKEGRNFPSIDNVSRLSPYLHFGEISPRQVWHDSKRHGFAHKVEHDLDHFHSELGWREFSNSLLFHFPHIARKPLQERFNNFPWAKDDEATLSLWQKGMTGYPIVDAGMRELWATGYMHNRVRMIVGSFLVKDLRLHWHHGEDWFWDCLVDADLANNSASWQWIAGCGADAAPYFRVFNPVTQGEKFDPDGIYVRRWCPELSRLPNSLIHKPWEAPALILKDAGVTLGKTYPAPMVDHKEARDLALQAFQSLKEA